MSDLNRIVTTLQANYILNKINKLAFTREDKLRLIDSIIADIRNNCSEHLDNVI